MENQKEKVKIMGMVIFFLILLLEKKIFLPVKLSEPTVLKIINGLIDSDEKLTLEDLRNIYPMSIIHFFLIRTVKFWFSLQCSYVFTNLD